MKTLKNIFYFLAAASLVGFTSCSDDDATTSLKGDQVFFGTDLSSTINLEQNSSSIQIPIQRMNADNAASYPLFSSDESGLFTLPSSADFAAGETTTNLVISYNFDNLTLGQSYPCTLTLADSENSSSYGLTSYSFTLVAVDPVPYETVATDAIFIEGGMSKMYRDFPTQYPVTVERKRGTNLFKIVNPYSYPTYPVAEESWTFISDVYIDATDPNRVVTKLTQLADFGYGMTIIGNVFGNLTVDGQPATEEEYPLGTYDEATGVFDLGAMFIADDEGAMLADPFKLYLNPDALVAAGIALEYTGVYTSVDGKSYAVISITPEADVATYRYAVVEGDITNDAEALEKAKEDILSGTLTSETGSGKASKGLELEAGEYTVVALAFDASGANIGSISSVSFVFTPGEVKDVDFSFTLESYTDEEKGCYPYNSMLVKMTASEIKSIKYLFAPKANVEDVIGLTDDAIIAYIKAMSDDYAFPASEIELLNQEGTYESVFNNLNAGTEYLCAMYVGNGSTYKLFVNTKATEANSSQASVPTSSVLNGGIYLGVTPLNNVEANGYIGVKLNSIDVNPASVEKVEDTSKRQFRSIRF